MSFQFLPLLLEVTPILLGTASVGASLITLYTRLRAERKLHAKIKYILKNKNIEKSSNKKNINKTYISFHKQKNNYKKVEELEELIKKLDVMIKRSNSLNDIEKNMIENALHQKSSSGKESYVESIFSKALNKN